MARMSIRFHGCARLAVVPLARDLGGPVALEQFVRPQSGDLGEQERRQFSTTVTSRSGTAMSGFRLMKAAHCICFLGLVPNAVVSATGKAGNAVWRRENVAPMASARIGPSKVIPEARSQMSKKSFMRLLISPSTPSPGTSPQQRFPGCNLAVLQPVGRGAWAIAPGLSVAQDIAEANIDAHQDASGANVAGTIAHTLVVRRLCNMLGCDAINLKAQPIILHNCFLAYCTHHLDHPRRGVFQTASRSISRVDRANVPCQTVNINAPLSTK